METSSFKFADLCRNAIEEDRCFYLLVDQAGTIVDANSNSCNLLETGKKEITGSPLEMFIETTSLLVWNGIRQTDVELLPLSEMWFHSKHGCLLKATVSIKKIKSEGGIYYTFFGTSTASTAVAPNQLRQLNELSSMQRTAMICGWTVDLQSGQEHWSNESYRLLAIDPNRKTASFALLRELMSEEAKATLSDAWSKTIATNRSKKVSFPVKVGTQQRFFRCTIRPVRSADGTLFKLTGTLQDVTDQKSKEKRLMRAKERAEVESLTKSAFVANVSHEIKTPVTAICGYIELVDELDIQPFQAREHLEIVKKNAKHLLEIISSLLDVSKIEANRFNVHLHSDSLEKTMDEAIALVQIQARQKNLNFKVNKAPRLPVQVTTDHRLVRHIMSNLLNNAFKYTDKGIISLDISFNREASVLTILITDTGCGMTEEQLSTLFTRFERFNSEVSEEKEGLGLGLSIAKKMAELLNGSITVESEYGVGSTFKFSWPVTTCNEEYTSPLDTTGQKSKTEMLHLLPTGKPKRILLAEDTKDIQNLYKTVLDRAGYEVDLAENGLDCVSKAIASKETKNPYDLILMDVYMPLCGGLSASRKLRESGWDGQIVAITANPVTGKFTKKYVNAGFDSWYSKSMSTGGLVSLVERCMREYSKGDLN